MRHLFFLAFTLIAAQSFGQNNSYYLSIGGTYSVLNQPPSGLKVDNQFGYYASASINHKLTNQFGVTGAMSYLNQSNSISDVKIDVNSVGASFLLNYYPLKDIGFKISAGMYMGLIVTGTTSEKGVFLFKSGVGYEIQGFEILATYNQLVSTNPFQSTATLGVGYRIGQD